MQYLVIWTIRPEHIRQAQERFKETGGHPPEGIKMLGRWHFASGGKGMALTETDDATGLAKWTQEWIDLLSFEIEPVLNDEQFASVLGE